MSQQRRLIELRNVVAHEYFGVDLGILWRIVSDELPKVRERMERVVEAESTRKP